VGGNRSHQEEVIHIRHRPDRLLEREKEKRKEGRGVASKIGGNVAVSGLETIDRGKKKEGKKTQPG